MNRQDAIPCIYAQDLNPNFDFFSYLNPGFLEYSEKKYFF